MYGNFLKKEISRETRNYNNVIELYEGVQDDSFKDDLTPSLFDNLNNNSTTSFNGNGKVNGKINGNSNGKVNGKINGNSDGKVNGNSGMKINGNSHNLLPVPEINEPDMNIINYNSPVIKGKVSEFGISYLNDRTFTFSIDVPKNIVVKLVDFMGMNLEGLVDDLCMPGHYVVKFSKNLSYNGTARYQMFIEDDTGDKLLENKPGRAFRLLEEKKIMIL